MSYAEIMYHWTVRKSDCWSWEDVSPVLEDARYGKWRGPWPAPHTILPLSTIYIEPSSSSLWINHFTIYINHFTIYINHFTIHINHTILPLSTIYIEPSSHRLYKWPICHLRPNLFCLKSDQKKKKSFEILDWWSQLQTCIKKNIQQFFLEKKQKHVFF